MADLEQVARLPGVGAVVRSDLEGTLLDVAREPDGEAVAAVMGFVAGALRETGETLGLGRLERLLVSGSRRASLMTVRPGTLVTAFVEPPQLASAVEKSLDTISREWT
jgi:hypothetical protein